jgi:phosphoserine aminotransferase
MTINFGAGPAKVPAPVLQQAQQEFLDYAGSGISVTELSHRSKEFTVIVDKVIANVREILNVPENYAVLLMHGGGVGQMAAVPMNLCGSSDNTVDYVVTGYWSQKAAKEAEKYCKVNKIEPPEKVFTTISNSADWKLTPNAKYLYYCDNETIHGVEFDGVPNVGSVPLVCDMTSNLFTRPVDVTKYGCIFAGAQKNFGIASLTLVIVRKDLIDPLKITPSFINYKVSIENNSMQNTPNCFAIYVMGLCLEWMKTQGGLVGMSEQATARSNLIYQAIDSSKGFYRNPVNEQYRSRLTIPFRIQGGNADLEKKFLSEAEALRMIQLKGHRSVGGIRSSMYNAMTVEEATVLANFMEQFRIRNSV